MVSTCPNSPGGWSITRWYRPIPKCRVRGASTRAFAPRIAHARPVDANRPTDAVVYIVDDDRRVREALCDLLTSYDLKAVAFGSAAEYLAYPKPDLAACVLLDVELPDINGLDLQARMAQGDHPHVVFVTGHGDIP